MKPLFKILSFCLLTIVMIGCRSQALTPQELVSGTHLYGLDFTDYPENSATINDIQVTCSVQQERGMIMSFSLVFLSDTVTMIDETGRQIVFDKEAPMTYVRSNTDSDLSRITISETGYSLATEMNGKPCVEYTYTLIDDSLIASR